MINGDNDVERRTFVRDGVAYRFNKELLVAIVFVDDVVLLTKSDGEREFTSYSSFSSPDSDTKLADGDARSSRRLLFDT